MLSDLLLLAGAAAFVAVVALGCWLGNLPIFCDLCGDWLPWRRRRARFCAPCAAVWARAIAEHKQAAWERAYTRAVTAGYWGPAVARYVGRALDEEGKPHEARRSRRGAA